MVAKIYLSSTYSDLIEQREAVYHTLRQLCHDVIAMEDYVATDQRPLDKCLADVASCDLYVGLFAWRYGYVPHADHPESRSITELEYRKAREAGKICLIFLLHEDAAWPRRWMDSVTQENERGGRIDALRQELGREAIVSFFRSSEELASLVSVAVSNWEKQRGNFTEDDPVVRLHIQYLRQVSRIYGSVKLPIGPASFSLRAIFQPLTLRRDPLAAEDLERGKRRALLGEIVEDSEEFRRGKDPLTRAISEREYQHTENITAANAEEALKESSHRRMVILGGPGAGKTTMLKYLAGMQAEEALVNPTALIPLFISLPALAHSGKSLHGYLTDIVEKLEIDAVYAESLWQAITAGRAFLCLDGLDEVDPRERADLIDFLNRKSAEPGNTWIIGSRFTEYKGANSARANSENGNSNPSPRRCD